MLGDAGGSDAERSGSSPRGPVGWNVASSIRGEGRNPSRREARRMGFWLVDV